MAEHQKSTYFKEKPHAVSTHQNQPKTPYGKYSKQMKMGRASGEANKAMLESSPEGQQGHSKMCLAGVEACQSCAETNFSRNMNERQFRLGRHLGMSDQGIAGAAINNLHGHEMWKRVTMLKRQGIDPKDLN
jgi:hypothetical protein